MCEVVEISDDEGFSEPENYVGVMPKEDGLGSNMHPQNVLSESWPVNQTEASTSGSNVRSSFIGMGFAPSVVDTAIEEIGDENAELLLETVIARSGLQQPKTEFVEDETLGNNIDNLAAAEELRHAMWTCLPVQSAHHKPKSLGFLGSLYGEDTNKYAFCGGAFSFKEEPDVSSGVSAEKMACLLKMNFSVDEVRFALDRLGRDASIDQLMDFIFAARMAKKYEKDTNHPILNDVEAKKDCDNEALFGIMEKTLRLLEMGFSEHEISTVFETCGTEVPLQELAESIVAPQISASGAQFVKHHLSATNAHCCESSYRVKMRDCTNTHPLGSVTVKTEERSLEAASEVGISDLLEKLKGKRRKEEYMDEPNFYWKKPKEEFEDSSINVGQMWLESRGLTSSSSNRAPPVERRVGRIGFLNEVGNPSRPMPNSSGNLSGMVAKPPYFLYGNVTYLSPDSWKKISQFLYSVDPVNPVDPEFVNTELYSALSRKEGYVHNLPTKDRSHILSKGPMTIEEAIPRCGKWWPPWDERKHLSHINCETSGISHMCDRLRRMLSECGGHLSGGQKRDLLQQCQKFSLVWVGHFKLAQIEPEHLERIMGYPLHHTRVAGFGLSERLQSLKLSFQTDALAYHLSVLKNLCKGELKILSFFSGLGGAEVALHRLGILLKVVVSVEHCERKRKILKQWWENTGQSGDLIQIESINGLTRNKLDNLINKFGGFDVIVCQNPYTLPESDSLSGSDFSYFAEFVRVLRHVRQIMEKNRV